MTATLFILFLLGLLGSGTVCYYAFICYPILAPWWRKRSDEDQPADVERKNLLSHPAEPSDHNDNSAPCAPAIVPDDTMVRPVRSEPTSYPVLPNPNQTSPSADAAFAASVGVPIAAASLSSLQNRIDEPDCAPRLPVKSKNLHKIPEACEVHEMRPLLHGDDEDGLIVCQPSVRSKTTGEPIPASSPHRTHVVIPISQPSDDPVEVVINSSQPTQTTQQPPKTEQAPTHVVLSIHQPIPVPPEMTMSQTHPPSNVIVTMVQPLNAPPLMVAPVYDEPPLEEQPTNSLRHQFHPVVAVPGDAQPNDVTLDVESETPVNYGWNNEETPEKEQRIRTVNFADDENPRRDTTVMASPAPVIVGAILKEDYSAAPTDQKKTESPIASSNGSLQETPTTSKGEQSEDTDTSDDGVTEYNLETAHLLSSTKTVLDNEISTVSEVKIIRYTQINEFIVMEADASINDSTRVHVGDLANIEDIDEAKVTMTEEQTEEVANPAPDFSIPRHSPDGDSLRSLEAEEAVSPVNSTQESPQQKCIPNSELSIQTSV